MSDAFDSFNAGSGFTLAGTTGGSWYVIPGANAGTVAGEDGKVLVGQFTVVDDENGDLTLILCWIDRLRCHGRGLKPGQPGPDQEERCRDLSLRLDLHNSFGSKPSEAL